MDAPSAVSLSQIVSALSYALDISDGHPTGHCVRACWLGVHIGRQMALTDEQLSELYYTLLLKDVGCSSNAARICEIYLADDISLKHAFQLAGDTTPQLLKFIFAHTGPKANLAERFRALINIIMNGGKIVDELFQSRCDSGSDIVRQMRFPESVATAVFHLDERWDGAGRPHHLKEQDIPLYSRIALLAQVLDVFYASEGKAAALAQIQARSGKWFDPAVVEAAGRAAEAHTDFWTMLDSPELPLAITGLLPRDFETPVDDDYLDDIATGFSRVIDAKSPFTGGHSDRVALFTDMISGQLGYSAAQRRRLRRAALLHDIGKLGVSNQILDKPARLNDDEWVDVRNHPVLGEKILARINVFQELSRIAGAHHERLDGRGYPRGIGADSLDLDTRIVTTADIFDALTADRPYRAAMSTEAALAIMERDLGTAIDHDCFEALKRALAATGETACEPILAVA